MRRRSQFEKGGGVITFTAETFSLRGDSTSISLPLRLDDVEFHDAGVQVSSTASWSGVSWNASNSSINFTCSKNSSLSNTRSTTVTAVYNGSVATAVVTQGTADVLISHESSMSSGTEYYPCHAAEYRVFSYKINGSRVSLPRSGVTVYITPAYACSVTYPNGYIRLNFTVNTNSSERWVGLNITDAKGQHALSFNQGYGTSIDISSAPYDGTENGHNYITIAGLKLATCLVGASSPGLPGNFYQWGAGSNVFDNVNDYHYTGSGDVPLANDTARQVMGGNWRMMSESDMDVFRVNTSVQMVVYSVNGTYYGGLKITDSSNANKWLAVPLAGWRQFNYSHDPYVGSLKIWLNKNYNTSMGVARHFYGDRSGHISITTLKTIGAMVLGVLD